LLGTSTMVATKFSEVVSKGYGWATGSTASSSTNTDPSTPIQSGSNNVDAVPTSPRLNNSNRSNTAGSFFSSPSALWDAASTSLSSAADQAYSSISGAVNYEWDDQPENNVSWPSSSYDTNNNNNIFSTSSHQLNRLATTTTTTSTKMNEFPFSFGSPWRIQNPYTRIRGRYQQSNYSSLSAVRSLLPLVREQNIYGKHEQEPLSLWDETDHQEDSELADESDDLSLSEAAPTATTTTTKIRRCVCPSTPEHPELSDPTWPYHHNNSDSSRLHHNSETASQLAEGTIRALRDIALDEAVEFHDALRYWSDRWEHPMLSWLEAGPTVWTSRNGYNHQVIGQKVAQIQAVLARRCAAIGELQQHLLRAGWQRGVAQWGVLGQGGQWATVQGTHVMTEYTAAVAEESQRRQPVNLSSDDSPGAREKNLTESMESSSIDALPVRPLQHIGLVDQQEHRKRKDHTQAKRSSSDRKTWHQQKGYYASVFVRNENNGKIHMDDAALAEWSVDAMALIRNLLKRASNGKVALPYEDNWRIATSNAPSERQSAHGALEPENSHHGQLILEDETTERISTEDNYAREGFDQLRPIPKWAKFVSNQPLVNSIEMERQDDSTNEEETLVISNLPLMAAEVSELLNSIEDIMTTQRNRRMKRLSPPSMFRRRWYLTAVAAPLGTYFIHHLVSKGYATELVGFIVEKVTKFFQEHVSVPFMAM